MDVNLAILPTPTTDNAAVVTRCLEHMSDGRTVATHIMQILREERATAYRERLNKTRHQHVFAVGDKVTARIQVQSRSEDGKVAKLLYKSKRPFNVVEVLGEGLPKKAVTYAPPTRR